MAPLVDVLDRTNAFFVRLGDSVGGAQHYDSEALLRRSALGALFDALPTFFLAPTLSRMVSLEGIFSGSLRGWARGDPEAMTALEAALAEKSPVRVLLSVLCAAITVPPGPGEDGRPALALSSVYRRCQATPLPSIASWPPAALLPSLAQSAPTAPLS